MTKDEHQAQEEPSRVLPIINIEVPQSNLTTIIDNPTQLGCIWWEGHLNE